MLIVEEGKIFLTRGDDAELTIVVSDYTQQEGDTIRLTVRENSGDTDEPLLEITTTTNVLTFEHEGTELLEVGEYTADIQIDTVDGKRYTVWPVPDTAFRSRNANYRNFIIMPEVTLNIPEPNEGEDNE